MGVHWKIWLLRGESWETNIEGGDCLKSGAWIVCWFIGGGGGLARKRGWCFWGGGALRPQCTLWVGLQNLKKKLEIKLIFFHAGKHQSFQQVDFNTLSINVIYKVMLSLLMGIIIKHSQSTQSSQLAIALQYLTNEVSHKAF